MCHPDWREDCESPYQQTCEDLGFGGPGACAGRWFEIGPTCAKKVETGRVIPNLLEYSLRNLTICLGGSDW